MEKAKQIFETFNGLKILVFDYGNGQDASISIVDKYGDGVVVEAYHYAHDFKYAKSGKIEGTDFKVIQGQIELNLPSNNR